MAALNSFEDLYKDASVQASTQAFDESKGVQGRVQSITSTGSPLMTAARTRAKQQGAKYGTLNSSLAGQAGEKAVIDSAVPIATADAQLFQNQSLANQSAKNNAALATASNRMNVGLTKFNLDENARQFNANLGENVRQFDAGLAWDKEKTGQSLAEQRRQFDAGLSWDQTKTGQSLAEQQRQFNTTTSQNAQQFADNLALERENLAAQREQFAQRLGLDAQNLQLQRDQLSQQDQQFLAELDQRDRQIAEQQRQFDTTTAQSDQQFAQRLSLERENLAAQREQFAQRLGLDSQSLELQRDQLSQQDQQFLAELDQKERQLTEQAKQFGDELLLRKNLAKMDRDLRQSLMDTEAKYKESIAGNENISRAWGSMMESISQIQNNPDIEAGAKATLISNAQNAFASFASFWQTTSGVDVSALLNFGPAPDTSGSTGSTGGSGSSGGSTSTPIGINPNGNAAVNNAALRMWEDQMAGQGE